MDRDRRLDAGAFDRAGDVQLLGETGGRARSFAAAERSHRRSRARTSDSDSPGSATIPLQDPDLAARRTGALCARTRFARRGDRHARGCERTLSRTPIARNLDHASLDVLWSTAEQLDAAIFVHPWDMVGKERMPKYWLPWLVGMPAETSLADLLDDFRRRVRALSETARGLRARRRRVSRSPSAAIEHAFHVRPDLGRGRQQHKSRAVIWRMATTPARFYVDSLVHDADALRIAAQAFRRATRRARIRLSLSVRRSKTRRTHRIDEAFRRRESATACRNSARISWSLIRNRRVERRRGIPDFPGRRDNQRNSENPPSRSIWRNSAPSFTFRA